MKNMQRLRNSVQRSLGLTISIEDGGSVEKLLEILPLAVELCQRVIAQRDSSLTAKWYDLETCFALRGGGAFSTFRKNRFYQPKGGIPDAKVQGRYVWSKETVQEWLELTDDELEAYHKKYATGAKKNG